VEANDIMRHFRRIGKWVDWRATCDQFLYGDPKAEVEGVATAWTVTRSVMHRAAAKGLNVIVSHEPMFLSITGRHGRAQSDLREGINQKRRQLAGQLGLTVMRCHDTWDRMPEVGIPDAWAEFLGFQAEPRPVESFYKVCLVDSLTVAQVGRGVLEKIRRLGEDWVLYFGDPDRRVSRIAVGTGAITHLTDMVQLRVDMAIVTDDGVNTWDGGLMASELDVPLLIVNHATAEKPGMQAMAKYLDEVFPTVPVEYIDVEFPYRLI